MKIKLLLLNCQLFAYLYSSAQIQNNPYSSDYLQLDVYSNSDHLSFSSNQAALAHMDHLELSLISEKRFLLTALGQYQATVSIPTKGGNFGITGSYFGNSSFNQTMIGLAYARKLGKLDLGIQFNNYMVHVTGYGHVSTVSMEAGALYHLTDNICTGIHIYNLSFLKASNEDMTKFAVSMSFGIGYNASENFYVGSEIIKTFQQPPDIKSGVQYRFNEKIFARIGISSLTSSYYVGTGVLIKSLRLDVTGSIHPQLGLTPGVLIAYNFDN